MKTLKRGLQSQDVFSFRRCQILLSSNEGQTPRQIAARFYCSHQYVRKVIRAFHHDGLDCLKPKQRSIRADRLDSLFTEDKLDAPQHRQWMLTVGEVARLVHVHPNTVRRWADTKQITSYRVGVRGDRRFKFDDVDSFLASVSRHRNRPILTPPGPTSV